MNELVLSLGLGHWKPLALALALPPVPWLVLMLAGGALLWRRRRLGWWLLVFGFAATWISCTTIGAEVATRWLLHPPEALSDRDRAALKSEAGRQSKTTIVVLGGGRDPKAEYPRVSLSEISMQRLRYGVWLARDTGLALGFSGGVSPGAVGPTESEMATRIAAEEFRHPLRWTEDRSRDTVENARRTAELLQPQGITHVVLVTHQAHMTRSLRAFERARGAAGWNVRITPAPVASRPWGDPFDWPDYFPSNTGWFRMRYALREWLGLVAGA